MQSTLFGRNKPRSFALRSTRIAKPSQKNVIVFENIDNSNDSDPQCNVKLLTDAEFEDGDFKPLLPRPVYGCFGLTFFEKDIFLAIVTECEHIGYIRPGESIHRILDVEFLSLTNTSCDINRSPLYAEESTSSGTHPYTHVKKLLSNGHFYFSSDFDLTRNLQARAGEPQVDKYLFQEGYLWNKFMINELLNFRSKLDENDRREMDLCCFLILAIQGYIGRKEVSIGDENVALAVISRINCERAGSRLATRGIDDDGNVANFIETETILHTEKWTLSYIQIRGSVPVFWEQQGLQVMFHKTIISRGPEATQPATQRHFNKLTRCYDQVHCINLLSQKEGEALLSKEYSSRVKELDQADGQVSYTHFDFYAMCKNGSIESASLLIRDIRHYLDEFEYFVWDQEICAPSSIQNGVFRTNCLSCLDRTNVIQTLISRTITQTYLRQKLNASQFETELLLGYHGELWVENGDSISQISAGTGALKSDITKTGKLTLAGIVNDATKSATRFYIGNFHDKFKQEVIDMLLGKSVNQKSIVIHDPIRRLVMRDLQDRLHDFSEKLNINVFVGTYNLNGVLPNGEPLEPWLFGLECDPELYIIGFQEIVELKPQQIVSADPEKLRIWVKHISKTLNERPQGKKYVLLRSSQLVGTALVVYARADVLPAVRNIEASMKKTGLGGMAGNKGAVAIRLDYYDTSLCFVTAHLFSGHLNCIERNNDYNTISKGLWFTRGRLLDHHENVIWLGDLNYRIDLPNELLKNQQACKAAFADFNEGDINFMPTYKYDNGTDNYDTSEKNRIPAWTDRILFRGKNIQLKRYSRAEIRISDHRPVLALFSIEITKYDELAKERIKEELYTKKKLTVEVTETETSQIAVKEGTELLVISEEIGTDCPCDVTSSTSEGDAAEATSATTKLLDNTESSQGEFSESILAPNEK